MHSKITEPSRGARVTGRILSGLVIAFLVFDASMKLVPIQPVMDAMTSLGFASDPELARFLGLLLLACTVVHIIPRTRILGAVLLTGFLGGAMAIQMRAGNPLLTHILFGAYLCTLMWVGLLLRNNQARSMLFRSA